MADLRETVASHLAARYLKLAGVVHELADPLSDEQFWSKPFPFGNSFGHLVLHLTGNLNYYIGAQIAGTGYVRDRPREFEEAAPPLKDVALKAFDDVVKMVVRTINNQSAEEWSAAYSAVGADAQDRLGIMLSCATHLHHHIGQMMYLGFELKRGEKQGRDER
ncbi:MAG TPA: DinB family protein [Terriglobales bacterium]|nr:DinB family protein [Terriglobales bacterium]